MADLQDDEYALQQLQEEERILENQPHNGFGDAVRVARLQSEIEAVEERISRKKQRASQGQG